MKVSIVLPTYNRAHVIGRAIKSVLDQTFQDFELIVVDDGSTDNTHSVVESAHDPRVRYVAHEKNRGLSAGRNTGARAARATYIANQDSDDVWDRDKLKREVAALDAAGAHVGVVYSRIEKDFSDGKKEYIPSDERGTSGDIHERLLKGNFITMQAALMKKECFEKVGGFDESLQALQDWDFWIRVSAYYEFVYVPEVGVRVAISSDSITRNKKKRLEARSRIIEKHREELRRYPRILAHHVFRAGHAYALSGDMSRARQYLREAWALSFFSFSYAGAFLSALFGSSRLYRVLARFM